MFFSRKLKDEERKVELELIGHMVAAKKLAKEQSGN
tara:strand:- start:240 stop:347 length:108 start_codon:yes stop_codon:yes gene_type:complete